MIMSSQKIALASQKKSIYDIFRSCRLCGSMKGYKMPIIQNIVELEDTEEISQKIKECAQIEVAIGDKMPPLICELCVTKIHDLHAFKLLCKNVNNQTRTRLGLGPQNPSTNSVDKGQTRLIKSSLGSRSATTHQTEPSMKGPRTLKKKSSDGIFKNRKPVRSVLSKMTPMAIENISEEKEETTSNKTTQKQTSVEMSEMEVIVKIENICQVDTESIATLKEDKMINENSTIKSEIAAINDNDRQYLKCDFSVYEHKKNDKPYYKCDKCENVYSTKSSLTNHIKRHTNEKSRECPICKYRFTFSSNLTRHIIVTHSNERPFKCNLCDKKYKQRSHLNLHKRRHTEHGIEKPYKCDECEVSFLQNYDLKVHKTIHSGEKPYKCDFCDYRGNRLGNLQVHMKMHTGEKPYKCNVCESKFSTHSNLKVHERVHTGEKPFKCNYCEYRSRQSSRLKEHEQTHTKKKRKKKVTVK